MVFIERTYFQYLKIFKCVGNKRKKNWIQINKFLFWGVGKFPQMPQKLCSFHRGDIFIYKFRSPYHNIISHIENDPVSGLLNSHPEVFQTITLPLFRAFQFRLLQDQLVQVKVRKVRLDQFSLTQNFELSKRPGVTLFK